MGGVFKLVMKYATFPNVRKLIPKEAPPGADDKISPLEAHPLMDCSSVWAEWEP